MLWQTKRNNKDQTSFFKWLLWPRNLVISSLLICYLAVLASSTEVQAMFGFFKRHTVEMSPEVRGRITDGGKPVVGMQVARSLVYDGYEKGKEQLAHTFTDETGSFSFQPMIVKSRKPGDIFGQNMPVMQAIYVERGDKLYSLWSVSKSWDPIKPLSNLLLQLNADLQNKEIHHELDTQDFGGRPSQVIISICYWQDDKISSYYQHKLITSYDEIN